MSEWVRLALGCGVLLAIAASMSRAFGVGVGVAQVVAAVRAVAQLAIVAAALRGVFAAPATSVVLVAVMFGVAVYTATGRLKGLDRPLRAVLPACALGAGVVIGVIVGLPTLDRNLRTLVAVSGIVIGGSMTAATLAGRHLLEGLRRRREEVEAWLSLGASPRQAVRDVARSAAAEALVPGLDQTRTVGLVTLPGAFVGALLGGASPVAAARFQLAVLVGLMAAQIVTAVAVTYLLGAPEVLPAVPADSR